VDGLIDSLVGALPVIVVVLWVIRLISRRTNAVKKLAAERTSPPDIPEPVPEPSSSPAPEGPGLEKEVKPVIRHRSVDANIQGQRILEDSPTRNDWYSRGNPVVSETADRFENLSPLARGMVWSIILDKPPALKEPEY